MKWFVTESDIPRIVREELNTSNIVSIRLESFIRNFGWGNGYVVLPSTHYFSRFIDNPEEIPVRVYGGVTCFTQITQDMINFSVSGNLIQEDLGSYIIGFDTAHWSSRDYFPTEQEVTKETLFLRDQCIQYNIYYL